MQPSGFSNRGFEPLREAFCRNFTQHGEIGAAISLHIEGEQVLSLWGGWQERETQTPWAEDTLTNVYSTTKGVAATIVAILVSKGVLNYERRVADYWPEFGAQGKENITVAMLMSHQSGLSGFRDPVASDFLYDARAAAAELAAMEPFWEPGLAYGYHPITVGFLVEELCIRATGKSIRELVAEYLAPRCKNGIYIGCPMDQENRVATLYAPTDYSSAALMDQELTDVQQLALANPPLDPEVPNTKEWRSAVIASANGFASAEGLSSLYASLANDEAAESVLSISPPTLQHCRTPQVSGTDQTLALEARWGCGFLINSEDVYGPEITAFGHSGWGGSFAFADPSRQIGFAYVMNKMGTDLINDPRNTALIKALYSCSI